MKVIILHPFLIDFHETSVELLVSFVKDYLLNAKYQNRKTCKLDPKVINVLQLMNHS